MSRRLLSAGLILAIVGNIAAIAMLPARAGNAAAVAICCMALVVVNLPRGSDDA